jgi:hypothetical protein
VDWIRLAQDRDRWQAVVSAVMNIRVLAPRISYITWRMSNWPVGGRSSETQSHHIGYTSSSSSVHTWQSLLMIYSKFNNSQNKRMSLYACCVIVLTHTNVCATTNTFNWFVNNIQCSPYV